MSCRISKVGAAADVGAKCGGKSLAGAADDLALLELILLGSAVSEGLRGRLGGAEGCGFDGLSLCVWERFRREGVRGDTDDEELFAGGTEGSTLSDGFLDGLDSDALREGFGLPFFAADVED